MKTLFTSNNITPVEPILHSLILLIIVLISILIGVLITYIVIEMPTTQKEKGRKARK